MYFDQSTDHGASEIFCLVIDARAQSFSKLEHVHLPFLRVTFALSRLRGSLSSALRHQIQHRHAHGEAIGYLCEYPALQTIRDVRRDLDSPVHRAGVHDEDVFFAALEAVPGEAIQAGELADAGKLAALDAFELDAEHVDHVH